MFCGECGNGVELSSGDCPSCGADLLDSVSYQKQGFVVSRPNTKTIVLVCCVIAMLTAGGLYYTSVDQLELQSQGSVQVLASEYHILHLTDVEEVRWNVTYYDSVWPKSLSSQYLTSDSLDAALEYSNGFTYFFDGSFYHRLNGETGEIDKTASIGIDGWDGVPTDLDAAFEFYNGKAYFFKGDTYYRYVNGEVDKVGEIGVDGWEGVPSDIDSAVPDDTSGVYFFKGDSIYHYVEGEVTIHEIGIDPFKGMENSPDAILGRQGYYIYTTGDQVWKFEHGVLGWAPGYDALFMKGEDCDSFELGEYVKPIKELSVYSTRANSSAMAEVERGDYCLVIDNSDLYTNTYDGRSLHIGWNIWAR